MSRTKLNQEHFIEKCVNIHGNKFDYSGVIYVNSITKITIKCNTCLHIWNVIPGNFTHNKTGCPNCKKTRHQLRMSKTIISHEEFIDRCIKIHNNKYNYTETKYTGTSNKIDVVCPDHGKFSQIAYDHSKGHGCNKCRVSKILDTKIFKGIIRNPINISEYENYYNKVWYQTEKNFREYSDIINPENHVRGYEYNLDHIFSMQQGFYNNISPEIIGHYTNLRLIPSLDNRIKHIRCDKTKEKLLEDYILSNNFS